MTEETQPTVKRKKRDASRDYVNNKDFSDAIHEYQEACKVARAAGLDTPTIPDYIGVCLMDIITRLSNRQNFTGYSYKDLMISDAIENCIRKIENFNIKRATRTGAPNAFSYYSQIAFFAFVRRINIEKKQEAIRAKVKNEGGMGAFAEFSDGDDHGLVNSVRTRADSYNLDGEEFFDDSQYHEDDDFDKSNNTGTWMLPKIDRSKPKIEAIVEEEEEVNPQIDLFDL